MTARSIPATEVAGAEKVGTAPAPRHDSLTRLRLAVTAQPTPSVEEL